MLHGISRAKHAAGIITSIAGIGIVFLAAPSQARTVQPPAAQHSGQAAIVMRASEATVYVKAGDTLSRISAAYCGSSQDWSGIYEANRGTLTSGPNVIYPGESLQISCGTAQTGYQATQASYQAPSRPQVAPAGAAPGSFQACVISRESGGNPAAVNSSSGAGGLYQFLPSTWASLGYSGLPQDAPVSTQTQAFNKLYAQSGTSPWAPSDGC